MLRHLKFKYKIMTLPLLAVSALLLLLFITQYFGRQNTTLFQQLEAGFAPALELGYNLEKTLTDLQRGLQDAVAAEDDEELIRADELAKQFVLLLERGKRNPFFNAEHLDALGLEFEGYYQLARTSSQALIEGKSLEEALVRKLETMSERYNALELQVKQEAQQAKKQVSLFFDIVVENNEKSALGINFIIICCTILLVGVSFFLSSSITTPLHETMAAANRFAAGENSVRIPVKSDDEIGELGKTLNSMMAIIERQDWLKSGQALLNKRMRGEQDIAELARSIIEYLATYLDAQIGAIYLYDPQDQALCLSGSYAYTQRKGNHNRFHLGESMVGQAALERQPILFNDVPDDYIKITSGVGEVSPRHLLIHPFLYEGVLKGVVELGAVHEFSNRQKEFLDLIAESIAIVVHSTESRLKMEELLAETQRQSNALQIQQEELRQKNAALEEQTRSLRASEEKLQSQQEELRQTNEELEEQARLLERQKRELGKKNRELVDARQLLEEKAKDLELSSRYKSEFLANMSHELRTPLNSLLILSKLLADNKKKNLTDKQVEFAQTIYSAGKDLLELINEILDLSKVESGKMAVNIEEMMLKGLPAYIEQNFKHMIEGKGLELNVRLDETLPPSIQTDRQRVEQVVKNLLSNAVKFTEKGDIQITILRPDASVVFSRDGLSSDNTVAIAVSDSGIGIPEDKQRLIFEAFQQVDGTIQRKYGGTGLGLSITRELAHLLGGEIHLQSEEGQGSTFTLFLPERFTAPSTIQEQTPPEGQPASSAPSMETPPPSQRQEDAFTPEGVEAIWDDRHGSSPVDKYLLIIEDDVKFAKILFELAREKGFRGLIAGDGEAGLQLAYQYLPSAIILDIGLPGMDGWTVMEKLKASPDTRHIPVHFISASDETLEAMRMGAIGYLTKPVSIDRLHEAFDTIERAIARPIKKILLVEENELMKHKILELFHEIDVVITTVQTAQQARRQLQDERFDCLILDLDHAELSDSNRLQLLTSDQENGLLPTIVYTERKLSQEEETYLKKHADSIICKQNHSMEYLLDEVLLFLHHVEGKLPEIQQKSLKRLHDKELTLSGKTIMVVDDDMRNVFALASVLEEKGMIVLIAEHGKEALTLLEEHPETDLILMDIMMPEMDGYEAMQSIRTFPKFQNLPIIALTARAMKGDRQKCIEAGASDYLSKPIDTDKLLSLLRVWLY